MSPIIGRILGKRGLSVSRQGDKTAGLLTSVQTFTQRVTTRCVWDHASHVWNVTVEREPIVIIPGTLRLEPEILWQGALTE